MEKPSVQGDSRREAGNKIDPRSLWEPPLPTVLLLH